MKVLPESNLPRFLTLVFNVRKPLGSVKAQREVLFFLPYLAAKFPDMRKLQRGLDYVLSFLNTEKLHAAISRCVHDMYLALGMLPKNFPAICSCTRFMNCNRSRKLGFSRLRLEFLCLSPCGDTNPK